MENCALWDTVQVPDPSPPANALLPSGSAGPTGAARGAQSQAEPAASMPLLQDSLSSSLSPVPIVMSSGHTGASEGSSDITSGALLSAPVQDCTQSSTEGETKTTEKLVRDAEPLPTPRGSAHAIAPSDDEQEHPPKSPRAGFSSTAAQVVQAPTGFDVMSDSVANGTADASASEPFSFGLPPSGSVG